METVRFDELNLDERILRAVTDMGFEAASPIQAQSIPVQAEGLDMIGQAQTGTGKTAAFGIPLLEKMDPESRKTQAMVLCPTRELAIQVAEEIRRLAKYMSGIKVLPVYGGQEIVKQIRSLKGGVQIIVGTPGRVMDHMRRKTIRTDEIRTVVLDEADEMLNMGFLEDMETILSALPEERQTVMFSATMPQAIADIAKKFQKDPVMVRVVKKELTVPKVTQYYYEVKPRNKVEVMCRLLDLYSPKLSVAFCNTKKQVDELVQALQGRGYFAEGLHGDLKQEQRDRVMDSFRNGATEILVATDVAARGIDVDDVEAVFNYDIPQDDEYYVHRIGRTGRIGKEGRAFTFVTGRRQIYELRDIERFTKSKITLKAVPSSSEVNETNERKFLDRVRVVLEEGGLEEYTPYTDALLEDYASLDISAALIKMLLKKEQRGRRPSRADDELFAAESRRNRMERDPRRRERGGNMRPNAARRSSSPRRDDANMEKISINLGRKHHVSASHILGAVAGESGLPGKSFGRIEILDNCTLVSVPREHVKLVIDRMKGCKIMGYQTVTRKLT